MTDFNLEHITHYRFTELFNELGWDRPAQQQPFSVEAGSRRFLLDSAAHKRGVQILVCRPDEDGGIPAYPVRQQIERRITLEVREHLIVYVDAAQTTQIWQWVNRQPGRPAQYRELVVRNGQPPELLRQKLEALHFTIDEEELLTVLGVTARLDDSKPRDTVTKKFYKEFEKQRKSFADFIEGIPRIGKEMSEDQRWYTAVLIDRLMFLWFLQEKGFLDGSRNYLSERFARHRAGSHKQSFYRRFLCPLFFRGFAEERNDGNRVALKAEFGDVPYLNGGLFAQHQLEQRYGKSLDVADAAFEKLFAFFGEWDWHLDNRPLSPNSREINPDVLGYIFEQFVNQKQMGAYYTKEDITEYIGKNTIIPCVLAKVRAEHPAAFDALAWPLMQQSGDAYIYAAMLKGVDQPYPPDIEAGLDVDAPDLLQRRKPWNKRAAEIASLPTEIWRETIARHQHTREMRRKIVAGEVREIGDLITCNLDIRQFAQDLIEGCTDLALLRSFWINLAGRLPRKSGEKFRHGLSVLDPTCGSGAFLFAALNILKPLYDATLRTLHAVRSDALIAGDSSRPERWQEIDEILERFAAARDERAQDYAVTKHIIVHNLYGVDIEEQATEIAKLRLFLKLVALLEPGDAIEPLPDIDFNIRHGNTLVGYATAEETERAVRGVGLPTSGNLFGDDPWQQIKLRLIAVEQTYNNFQIQQVQRGGHVTPEDKQALSNDLAELEETLNRHLARDYGVDPDKSKKYQAWKASHQPFHWYVDFYPLMAAGGFDVVIGNPPYVEMHKVKGYSPRAQIFATASCGNLYAPMLERVLVLCSQSASRVGQIVPISCVSTTRMQPLREVWEARVNRSWISHYSGDAHPSVLFNGVKFRLSIVLQEIRESNVPMTIFTTAFLRWFPEARRHLFDQISYTQVPQNLVRMGFIPKLCGSGLELLRNMVGQRSTVGRGVINESTHTAYAHRIVAHYVKAFDFVPFFCSERDGEKKSEDYKSFSFRERVELEAFSGLLNSTLFYFWFVCYSDVYHCGRELILDFPADIPRLAQSSELLQVTNDLMSAYRRTSIRRAIPYKATGMVEYDEFYPRRLKLDIDQIDHAIATHFALSPQQLDFVINFDLKYRSSEDISSDV